MKTNNVHIPVGTDLNNIITEEEKNTQNLFPVAVFPAIFRNLINEYEESFHFPPDYSGTSLLTAVSTAIGTSAKIKVKTGWYELPSIYAVNIGGSGTSKTHSQAMPFEIFSKIDTKSIEEYESLLNKYEEYQSLDKKDKRKKFKNRKAKTFKNNLTQFHP